MPPLPSPLRSLAAVGLLAAWSGCQSNVVGLEPVGEAPLEVSFAADVAPILTQSCAGACHGASATAGVEVTSHAALLASRGDGYGGPVVVPGDADASPLIDKLGSSPRVGTRMPLGAAPLSAAEVRTLRAWIDAGARDD